MNSIGVIITIIFVVIWVVKGLASVMGNNNDDSRQNRPQQQGDLEQRIAARRAERARQAQQEQARRAQVSGASQGAPTQQDLSQMSMAERIELARQRAKSGPTSRRELQAQRAEEGMRQAALEKEQAQAREREQAIRRQQAQEEARRRQALQEREQRAAARKQQQEQQARAEQLERRRRRAQKQGRQARKTRQTRQPSGQSSKQAVPARSKQQRRQQQRRAQPQGLAEVGQQGGQASAKADQGVSIGPLDTQSLRRAFIMKELLDKPVALRDQQDGLAS